MFVFSECIILTAEILHVGSTRAQVVQLVVNLKLGCPSSLIAACRASFELAEVHRRCHRQVMVSGRWYVNG